MTTLENIETYLIGQGLVRSPRVAGTQPPLWIEPDLGIPAPGEGDNPTEIGEDMVIGVVRSTGLVPRRMEKFLRNDGAEFVIMATKAVYIHEFEPLLRNLLHDKTQWSMGGLLVHYSQMVRDIQPAGVDESGVHVYTTEYLFETWDETT